MNTAATHGRPGNQGAAGGDQPRAGADPPQLQPGQSRLPQTLGALKSLLKRLRYYQVALDEESALDASGNVHRRRESSRGERF